MFIIEELMVALFLPMCATTLVFSMILDLCRDPVPNANHARTSQLPPVERKEIQNPLVTIHAFCLMPNHFHLLLRQEVVDGISTFMHRLGTAYSMFFNIRYDRKGRLFQQTFRARSIDTEAYFLHISRYIHLNPLDLLQPNWKKRGATNTARAWKFIEKYAWSSYSTYLGSHRYEHWVNSKSVLDLFSSWSKYRTFVRAWTRKDYDGPFLEFGSPANSVEA